MTLKNWHAKRAGGRITIYGTDIDNGDAARITRVDKIEPTDNHCVATVDGGTTHKLLLG